MMVVDEKGVNRGVLSYDEAIKLTDLSMFDLQLMNDTPPVARIVPRAITTTLVSSKLTHIPKQASVFVKKDKSKELDINSTISIHDLKFKTAKLVEFLEKGISTHIEIKQVKGKPSDVDVKAYLDEATKECGVLGSQRQDRKVTKLVYNPKKK